MLSAWWLCLIIPVSGCIGYLIFAFMFVAKPADEIDEKD